VVSTDGKSLRFRKFSPIDREYPIFELVEGENVLLDIGATDEGLMEVAIHAAAANKLFRYDQLMELLIKGQKLLEDEMKEDHKGDNEPLPRHDIK
jgi:hypothetical protein